MDYTFYLVKNKKVLDNFIGSSISENSINYGLISDFCFRHPLEDPSFSSASGVIEDFNGYKNDLSPENKDRIEEFLQRTWWVASVDGVGNFLNEEQENLAKRTEPSFFSIIDLDCAQDLIELFNKIDLEDLEFKYSSSMEFAYKYFKKDLLDWKSMLQQINKGEFFIIFMG